MFSPSVQICDQFSTWNVHWDDQQKVPFACRGNQFVGFDDIKSTIIKVWNSHTNKFYHMWIYASMQFQLLTVTSQKLSLQNIYIMLHARWTHIIFIQQLSIPLYHNYAGQCPLTLEYVLYTKFQEFSLLVYTYLRLTRCFYM